MIASELVTYFSPMRVVSFIFIPSCPVFRNSFNQIKLPKPLSYRVAGKYPLRGEFRRSVGNESTEWRIRRSVDL